jgi:hypothetical protein
MMRLTNADLATNDSENAKENTNSVILQENNSISTLVSASPSVSAIPISNYVYRIDYTFPYPSSYAYSNRLLLWDFTTQSYVYMSAYGISSGSYTTPTLQTGHKYEALIVYYTPSGVWTNSWDIFKPTYAATAGMNVDQAITITCLNDEGGYIIPVYVTFWYKVSLGQLYSVNDNTLKSTSI